MKKTFRTLTLATISMLSLLTSTSAQVTTKQIDVVVARQEIAGGNFAIVVGVNDYAEEEIADLNYCEKDARDFAATLTEQAGYDSNRVRIFLGKQATYTAIYAALKSCADAKNIPPKSSIMFYFSGHGFAYENKNYIIPQDGTVFPDLIQNRNLNLETIESMLAESPFERQLVFIDACRNQVTIGGRDVGVKGFIDTPLTANAKGMKVFLGTEFGQVSRESTDIQSGIFTHYLVEGLAGAADANRDGIVLFNELSGYVSMRMEERNIGSKYPQRPVTRGEGSELIPVAALPGGFEEVEAGGTSTGGTVEAITPSGTGSASGFGTLKLTIGLDGVQCFVDGVLKGSSTGGAITVENLAPGEHTVKLFKEGYETREFKAQVFAGQVIEKSLNFSKISGIIRVMSNAFPYHIYLDGAYVTLCQTASFDVTDVNYGAHTVVLKKSGYADAEYKVTITASAPVAVQGSLTRVYGQLTVITNPPSAMVKITSSDDVVVTAGFSGKSFSSGAEATSGEPLNLTPGSYTVTITKDGYEAVTKSVTIAVGTSAVVDAELQYAAQPATLLNNTTSTTSNTLDSPTYLGFLNLSADKKARVISMTMDKKIVSFDYEDNNHIGPNENDICRLFNISGLVSGIYKFKNKTWKNGLSDDIFAGCEYQVAPSIDNFSSHLLWWTGPKEAIKKIQADRISDVCAIYATQYIKNKGLTGISVYAEDVHQIIRCDLNADGNDEVLFVFDSMKNKSDESRSGVMQDEYSGVIIQYLDVMGNTQYQIHYLCANDNVTRLSLDIGGVMSHYGVWSWDGPEIQGQLPYGAYTDEHEVVGIIDIDGNGSNEVILYYYGFEWEGYEVLKFDGLEIQRVASNGIGF